MDIAAASISMSTSKVQQQVNISLMKKTMDSTEASAVNLLNKMLPKTPVVSGEIGRNLDVTF